MLSSYSSDSATLWWQKMGKWQVMAIAVTLSTFFATLPFTGSHITSGLTAGIGVYFFLIFIAMTGFADPAVANTVTTATITAAGAVLVGATDSIGDIGLAVAFLVGVALVNTANKAGEYGVSKQAVWLSYTAEFVIILVSMLLLLY